jgi:hypothetical protein
VRGQHRHVRFDEGQVGATQVRRRHPVHLVEVLPLDDEVPVDPGLVFEPVVRLRPRHHLRPQLGQIHGPIGIHRAIVGRTIRGVEERWPLISARSSVACRLRDQPVGDGRSVRGSVWIVLDSFGYPGRVAVRRGAGPCGLAGFRRAAGAVGARVEQGAYEDQPRDVVG